MSKPLKSTHVAVEVPKPASLPAPWTEHKAPTGHIYYYNPETKQSTYTRPVAAPEPEPVVQPAPLYYNPAALNGWSAQPNPSFTAQYGTAPAFRQQQLHQRQGQQNRQHQDRPKTKHPIPGHSPWLLVKTRLGRRFVHNPDTMESFWKVPHELIAGLVEFDIQEKQAVERKETGAASPEPETQILGVRKEAVESKADVEGSVSEYEEVEVTDSEYELEGHPPKRRRTSDSRAANAAHEDEDVEYLIHDEEDSDDNEDEYGAEDTAKSAEQQTAELGEADMAAQLAEMGESYGLDPSEYYHEDVHEYDGEEGDEPAPYELTEAEAQTSFKDMLEDAAVNPYSTWDSILESHSDQLVADDRYTLLPNMRSRREVFASWSVEKIKTLKEAKETQIKLNPRIPYLKLLEQHATPKLFWAEFKRKFKREPEMKDQRALSDKEREKLYRDYISKTMKTSEEQRKSELQDVMQSIPPSKTWNRSSNAEGLLPDALLADVRYVALKPSVRDPLIMAFVRKLPRMEELSDELTEEERVRKQEREKRDEAMRKRSDQVEAKKRAQQRELQHGQRRLREEELELERASKVGRAGLREQLEV